MILIHRYKHGEIVKWGLAFGEQGWRLKLPIPFVYKTVGRLENQFGWFRYWAMPILMACKGQLFFARHPISEPVLTGKSDGKQSLSLLKRYLHVKAPMTKEEFEKRYAEGSHLTVDWFHSRGYFGVPCACGADYCDGWIMQTQLPLKEKEG